MELTRTPLSAHSRARNWVRFNTAALAAEYATTRETGRWAATEAMLMMLPRPRATMAEPNSWQGNSAPAPKFRSKQRCQSSGAIAAKSRSSFQGHLWLIAAGRVEEHVDGTQRCDDRFVGGFERRFVRGVAGGENARASGCLYRCYSLVSPVVVASQHCYGGSGFGQSLGHCPAQYAGAADDCCYFAVQIPLTHF